MISCSEEWLNCGKNSQFCHLSNLLSCDPDKLQPAVAIRPTATKRCLRRGAARSEAEDGYTLVQAGVGVVCGVH